MHGGRLQWLVLFFLIAPLVGCPNLSQVQKLSQTVDAGKAAANVVAADFVQSCDRQNLNINLPPGPPPEPPPVKACSAQNREDFDHLGKNLATEQSVLFDYIDAIGKLSAADASGFEKAAPALNTSFKTAGLSSTQQDMASAAGSLASAITKLATLGYREKEVADIIAKANTPVRTLATGLANQIAPANVSSDDPCGTKPPPGTAPTYLSELCNEQETLNSYYDVPLASEQDPGVKIMLRMQYQTAIDQLTSREKAAIAYRTFMIGIADAHDKLVTAANNGFNKDAVKALASQISGPISDISDAVSTLEKDAR